jgi:hypothetical protein
LINKKILKDFFEKQKIMTKVDDQIKMNEKNDKNEKIEKITSETIMNEKTPQKAMMNEMKSLHLKNLRKKWKKNFDKRKLNLKMVQNCGSLIEKVFYLDDDING